MTRVLKHPVAQFLAAGLVTVVLVLVATGRLSGTAAADEAIEERPDRQDPIFSGRGSTRHP